MSDTAHVTTTDLLGAGPPTTREGAVARRDALLADENYRAEYLKGDPAKVSEIAGLFQTITKTTENPAADADARLKADIEKRIETYERTADLPPAVIEQIRNGTPVTPDDVRNAQAEKAKLFADQEWVKRYLAGGRAERTRMTLVSIILGSPVAEKK